VPRRGGLEELERARVAGCLLGGAIVVAPFLALLYDVGAGLAVMAVALGATAWGAVQGARLAARPLRRRLFAAAAVNGVLAVGCVVALVVRLG